MAACKVLIPNEHGDLEACGWAITARGWCSSPHQTFDHTPTDGADASLQTWYTAPDSECPDCGHGPRWHNDPSGCTRMNGPWCECERVYAPSATGPDDVTTYVHALGGTLECEGCANDGEPGYCKGPALSADWTPGDGEPYCHCGHTVEPITVERSGSPDACPDCTLDSGDHAPDCDAVEHWDDYGTCAACQNPYDATHGTEGTYPL